MSNTEVIDDVWSNRTLTEAQRENRASAELIPFGDRGITPTSFAQVVDWAKMMARASGVVGAALMNNPGACLAIIELGQKFKMSPYMLARGCYSVNGVLAFDGQTINAIMNEHMPLEPTADGKRTRLKYRFDGEVSFDLVDDVDDRTGVVKKVKKDTSTLRVIVTGRMKGEADELEYKSPMLKDINNKKSPLWQEDPEQQLIYWASRRWQRRWWPEGLLGIYDREDAAVMHVGADNAKLIESSPGAALVERVRAAQVQTDDANAMSSVREGFSKDHTHNETTNGDRKEAVSEIKTPAQEKVGATTVDTLEHPDRDKREAQAEKEAEPEHEIMPRNAAEWKVYCMAWIAAAMDIKEMEKKWNSERKLRNDCGVTSEIRDPVFEFYMERKDQIKSPTT